jgi:FOG: EAL domain
VGAQGISLQYVAVNVSPQQFRDPRFKDSVREAIELTGIDPRRSCSRSPKAC